MSKFYSIDTEAFLANLLLYNPILSFAEMRKAKKKLYKDVNNCYLDLSVRNLTTLMVEYPDMFLIKEDRIYRLFDFDPEMVEMVFTRYVDKDIRESFVESCFNFIP